MRINCRITSGSDTRIPHFGSVTSARIAVRTFIGRL